MNKYFLTLLLLAECALLLAQNTQSEFLEAKRLFREEQYAAAQSAFASLANDATFGSYATFFAGLSAYRLDDKKGAISIWELILSNDPSWDQLPNVHYWLVKTHFELEAYEAAITYCNEYEDRFANNLDDLKETFIPGASVDELKNLNERFPDDQLIVVQLARKLDRSSNEDVSLLRKLIADHNLEVSDYADVDNADVRRSSYAIAVMLPFMFDGLESTNRILNNKVIVDLYQGMLLAQQELDSMGMPVTLYPYDTKRDKKITETLLKDPSLKETDLIIGPLLPGPIEAVRNFSIQEKINMVNPVSSNQGVIAGNDFAFLLKPSYLTIGRELAESVIPKFQHNKRALIYFSNNARDSLLAQSYRETLEAAGFDVLHFKSVDNKTSRAISDSLSEQHEEFLTMEQVDSLSEIPDYKIESRTPDPDIDEEMEFLVISEEEETLGDSLIYYEMKFDVVEDSIGHIMVSSRENGIVNNFIGSVESRTDSVGLFGYGNWFDFRIIDYDQYERLELGVAFPEFLDAETQDYKLFQQKMIRTFGSIPSDFSYQGYEGLMYLGYMLHTHGKYFQNGFLLEGYTPGKSMSGFEFGTNRDNQIVPIIGFKDSRLTPLENSNGSNQE